MRKLIFMSIWAFPLILAIRASGDTNARRGLRKTTVWTLVFTAVWALVAPWLASLSG